MLIFSYEITHGQIRPIQALDEDCRRGVEHWVDEEERESEARPSTAEETTRPQRFFWTEALQQSFREELEKLVVLDYIMRNTDRGLDNWMIKVDWQSQEVSIVSEPPKMNGSAGAPEYPVPIPVPVRIGSDTLPDPYRRQETMVASSRSTTPLNGQSAKVPSLTIGAIDNSLSWPWKHPDAVSYVCIISNRVVALTITVAQFSFWLAFPPSFAHRTAILTENTRPFPTTLNIYRLVE